MDGAPTAGVPVSEATAAAAATFACPSGELAERFAGEGVLARLADAVPCKVLPAPGALPIEEDGVVVGALGIGGPAPALCAELTAATLAGAAAAR